MTSAYSFRNPCQLFGERSPLFFFFFSKVASEILSYSKMKIIIFLVLRKNVFIVKSSSNWKEGRERKGQRSTV